ncbi:hypothetical protein HY450_00435 [Candidatus Pacearchaeota archaeon]|nr:hypothetical protein [Candidatus Pacearchaeota archaeon]
MKNKKILILAALIGVLSIAFVAARSFSDSLDNFLDGSGDAISFLLGDVQFTGGIDAGQVFFIKLLVFIILFAVVYKTVANIPQIGGDKAGVRLIISLAVSLIAVRYITTESLVNFIWLPYGVLGVFFATILPFAIGFFFIEGFNSSAFRKIGWSAYVIIFAALAYLRWDDLSLGLASDYAWWENLGILYLAIAVLSFLLIIFDKNVRAVMFRSQIKSITDTTKRARAARIQADINDLYNDLARAPPGAGADAIKAELKIKESQLQNLIKPLS